MLSHRRGAHGRWLALALILVCGGALAPAAAVAQPAGIYGIASVLGYKNDAAQFGTCTVIQVPCPASDLVGYSQSSAATATSSAFATLKAALPLAYARFGIDYDALEMYSAAAGGCVPSTAAQTVGQSSDGQTIGQFEFDRLAWAVQASEAAGLTPVVAFTTGNGTLTSSSGALVANQAPFTPEPTISGSTPPYGALTDAAYDYSCGVSAIISQLDSDVAAPVTLWEAWNEPNGAVQSGSYGGGYNGTLGACTSSNGCASGATNPAAGYPNGPCASATFTDADGVTVPNACGGTTTPAGQTALCPGVSGCGPWEAEELWGILSDVVADTFPSQAAPGTVTSGWHALTGVSVATDPISDAQNGAYEGAYLTAAVQDNGSPCAPNFCSGAGVPVNWAVHDYDDPSSGVAGANADISAFTKALAAKAGTGRDVWITETGVNLTSRTESDDNRTAKSTLANPWTGCTANEPGEVQSGEDIGFGDCVDAVAAGQQAGAESFLNLHNAGNGENITMVDWFEFQPDNESTGWDSGLLSAAPGSIVSPDGLYSQPRASFCVLAPSASCSAAAADASAWSTQQAAALAPAGAVATAAAPPTGTATASVSVAWTAPSGPPAGTSYDVFENGSATPLASGLAASPASLSGLAQNRALTFEVSTVTGGVVSPAATASVVTLSGPPTGLSAARSATTVTLGWTAPSASNPPSAYAILEQKGSGAFAPASGASSCGTTCAKLTGLAPLTKYAFEVESVNSAGTPSSPAGPVSLTTGL